MRSSLFAVLVLLPALARALVLQTVEPRAFGYTVGDVLERRVLVDRARDGVVDRASLPKPGRSGRWFQLREVTALPDGLRLAYQIVNAPPQPDRENLPALGLRVIGPDGQPRDAEIAPFTVTMTPVVHFGPYDVIQSADVRPDLEPPPIDASASRRRVLACAAALLAQGALLWAPGLARRLGWRKAGPFARARRVLRRLPARGDDIEARRQALRRLHQALDEAAGLTLALDNVELLFQTQPWLAPARAQVEALFADSRATFFGRAPPPTLARLVGMASQWAELERRR